MSLITLQTNYERSEQMFSFVRYSCAPEDELYLYKSKSNYSVLFCVIQVHLEGTMNHTHSRVLLKLKLKKTLI